ncbi:MAG: hypothetical protein ACM3SU_11430 [Acidobacteriota bacterium]
MATRTLVRTSLNLLTLLFSALSSHAAEPAVLRLPLKAETLSPSAGSTFPSYDTLELARGAQGRYDVRLLPGETAPRLRDADFRLLVPRVPRLARGNDALTRLALIQREFNRNEVHNALPSGLDFSIANNCLERGLWEVKLARSEAGKTVTIFHAWLTFPKEEYARLFREANGLDYEAYDKLLASYPGVGGFPVPLAALRAVKSERELASLEIHAGDPLDRLTEQRGKVKLLKTEVPTYGDFTRPGRQPIMAAKFVAPGVYDPADTMRFDLTWLAHPSRILWREVSSPNGPGAFPEIEIDYENGYRIVIADAKLANLPARREVPVTEADVLKLVCGIGTPIIHAPAAERASEMAEDRPRYLMILDARRNHVDNHLAGVDGIYAWRDAGEPGRLHLWLVGYERIALVSHLSARWPPPRTSGAPGQARDAGD